MRHVARRLQEDGVAAGAANAVGSGSVEGTGVGPRGEPGVIPAKKKLRSIVVTRNPVAKLNTSGDTSV